jgi:hypothetical protein
VAAVHVYVKQAVHMAATKDPACHASCISAPVSKQRSVNSVQVTEAFGGQISNDEQHAARGPHTVHWTHCVARDDFWKLFLFFLNVSV